MATSIWSFFIHLFLLGNPELRATNSSATDNEFSIEEYPKIIYYIMLNIFFLGSLSNDCDVISLYYMYLFP